LNALEGGIDYPRPQFRRAEWQNLNGRWRFSFADENSFAHTIQVPFAPESSLSGIGDSGFHKSCWYERDFEVEKSPGRLFLHFGAVDYNASVWVNGQFVGKHQGGHTPFSFEITKVLRPRGRQTVRVHAEDDPQDLAKPRGKQDWELNPHSIWYPRTTGIWQTVWLERVPETYIDQVRWTPHLERWEIGFEGFVNGSPRSGFAFESSPDLCGAVAG
jgi:beta-galactosidase/beta-glucuronidase